MVRYYALHIDEDSKSPDVVFRRVEEDGLYFERLDRVEKDWVEDNALYSFFQGELGAEAITAEEARQILGEWEINPDLVQENTLVG